MAGPRKRQTRQAKNKCARPLFFSASAGSWSLSENGADWITTVDTGDSVNGNYTQTQTGVDNYTITERGVLGSGSYSLTLTGTESPTQTETGNLIQGTFDRTVVGGGSYTRTETGGTLGSATSTNAYTLTVAGNNLTGDYSQGETGTDRFGLIEQFDNIADTSGVATPGHMQYHPFGAQYSDDDAGDIAKRLGYQPNCVTGMWSKLGGTTRYKTPNDIPEVAAIMSDRLRYLFKTEFEPLRLPAKKQTQEEADKALIQQIRTTLMANAETRKLLEDFEGAGGKFVIERDPNLNYTASATTDLTVIFFNPVSEISKSEAAKGKASASYVLFELLRAKFKKDQDGINKLARSRTITEDQYAEACERLTFKLIETFNNIIAREKTRDPGSKWAAAMDSMNLPQFANWDAYKTNSQRTGHWNTNISRYRDMKPE